MVWTIKETSRSNSGSNITLIEGNYVPRDIDLRLDLFRNQLPSIQGSLTGQCLCWLRAIINFGNGWGLHAKAMGCSLTPHLLPSWALRTSAFLKWPENTWSRMCMVRHFSRVWLFATLWPVPTRFLCPCVSPGKNMGVGCQALLQQSRALQHNYSLSRPHPSLSSVMRAGSSAQKTGATDKAK